MSNNLETQNTQPQPVVELNEDNFTTTVYMPELAVSDEKISDGGLTIDAPSVENSNGYGDVEINTSQGIGPDDKVFVYPEEQNIDGKSVQEETSEVLEQSDNSSEENQTKTTDTNVAVTPSDRQELAETGANASELADGGLLLVAVGLAALKGSDILNKKSKTK